MMIEPVAGEVWERDDSRRVIKEVNPYDPTSRTQVIYTLYRRVRVWQGRDQWWLCREGYCSLVTFGRWARHATQRL